MSEIPRKFLQAIPKSDLHVHLGGSLRIATLIELAKAQKLELPSYTEEGLRTLVYKDRYKNLTEYLVGFHYTHEVMRTPETLERAAYELAIDNWNEGVCYVEVRFAAQAYIHKSTPIQTVLMSVNRGLERAKKEINNSAVVKNGEKPPFQFGVIGCAMRTFAPGGGSYFSKKGKFALAAVDLVKELVKGRDKNGLQIVGFDLAGEEKGYPAEEYRAAFDLAHRHFLKKTVHAGEAYGPSSIFQAITECHADRIGHGTSLFDAHLVDDLDPKRQQHYVNQLVQYIGDRRIAIEVCLSSNLQTIPELKSLKDHPFGKMLEARLSTAFCTDNRLVSNTTVTDEIAKAVDHFDINADRLRNLIIYGFKRSFFFGDYTEKRNYVRQVIDHYERLQREYGLV